MSEAKPAVLFLCTANSCRSQLAEAILRQAAGDRYVALSAGLEPADAIHPLALRVLTEKGYPVAGLRPKGVREFLGHRRVNHVIVVCASAAQACPTVWPGGAERLYWPIDDPAAAGGSEEETLARFRQARDEIEQRIADWLDAQRLRTD
ncbi:arsenate reductase ArsC [candidate division WOR-3 bacterium]|nr:arsenate reductase ArsC [candidate division WOR-3 bacterium]